MHGQCLRTHCCAPAPPFRRAARVLFSPQLAAEEPPGHRRALLASTGGLCPPCELQVSWIVLDALEGKRWLHEIDAETHRCAKFLFASVDSENSEVVIAAICMNVENELSLRLSPAEVAAWLGKTAEAHVSQ